MGTVTGASAGAGMSAGASMGAGVLAQAVRRQAVRRYQAKVAVPK